MNGDGFLPKLYDTARRRSPVAPIRVEERRASLESALCLLDSLAISLTKEGRKQQ